MECRKEIIDLYNSDEYQRLKAYYAKRSMLDILGVARSELAHSNMLAWLLDPNETHGLGSFPMRKFLHLLVVAKLGLSENFSRENETRAEFDTALMDSILTNSCVVESVSVEAEKAVDSTGDKHKDSRIDIYAEVALRLSKNEKEIKILPIVVENKVGSKEHDDQTKSYHDWCMKEVDCNKDKYFPSPLFVFLTAHRTLALNGDKYYGGIPCSCPNYIRINYQYIVDYLIEQCLKQSISEDTRKVLKDYLRSLTYTYINGDIKEGDTYMAISEEERKLLVQFWKNNENLLSAVIEAFADDPDTDSETSKKLKDALISRKKDLTKYKVNGVDGAPLPKGRMVLEVVKKFVRDRQQENRDVTWEDLKRAFNRKEIKCGFKGVVVKADERHVDPQGRKRYFDNPDDIIKLNDAEVCVCSNWGKGNIETFIKRANELGFTITPV